MKTIKKRALSQLEPVRGAVVDTFNVQDKVHNAPSVRANEEKFQNKILHGTGAPSASMGNDGDIYLQHV